MTFNSFPFKLVVIDALIANGTLEAQLQALEAQYAAEEWEDYYGPNPAIEHALEQLELTPGQLATVKELVFDGGNEIYQILAPNWDGEDEQFAVTSIADVTKLPNLEAFLVISMVRCPDLSPLLSCTKLRKLAISTYESDDQQTREQLAARGVAVKE
jgi:hypothetical protein